MQQDEGPAIAPVAVSAGSPVLAAPAGEPADRDDAGSGSALFGRGLSYVAVWSLQLLSSLLVFPVLAHLLEPAEFGRLASAIALHQVLVVLAVVGLDQVLVVLRAELGSDRPARSLVALGLATACALTAAAAVTAPLWSGYLGFTGSTRVLVLAIAWTPPAAALQLVAVLLLAQDRLRAYTLMSVLTGVGGQLTGVVVLGVTGSRLASSYAIGNLVALLVALAVGVVLVRPRWHRGPDRGLARRAFTLGVPLMVGALAIYVLNAGDRLVVQRVLGPAEAGRYQIAYTIGNLAVMLLSVTSGAWAPRISAVRDEAARWVLIGVARDGLLRLLAPVVLGMTLGAPLLLLVIAPASYAPTELLPVVFLVVLAAFPVLAGVASGRALISLQRTGAVAVAAVVAAVLNVALNLLLVPLWGLAGAAAATVVAFTVQAGVQHRALSRYATLPRVRPAVWSPAAVAVVVGLGTLPLPSTPGWVAGRVAAGLLCLPWLLVELQRLRRAGDAPGSSAAAGPAVPGSADLR